MSTETALPLPDLAAAKAFFAAGDNFLLSSHVNSDGDAIGACLALKGLWAAAGKQATIVLHDNPPDPHYNFLVGWDTLRPVEKKSVDTKAQYAVVLDCPSLERIGDVQQCLDENTHTLNIDHHRGNELFGAANVVTEEVSSSCELVYHLAIACDMEIDQDIATQLYTGILFDTGGFRFSLTRPTTFEAAADLVRRGVHLDYIADQLFSNKNLGLVKQLGAAIDSLALHHTDQVAMLYLSRADLEAGDPDEVVNQGLMIKGVEVAVLLKEEEPQQYRVSLRSRDRIDVNQIAGHFGGGGHVKASGCRLKGYREEVERQLLDEIGKHL